jgi:hypothetical protein
LGAVGNGSLEAEQVGNRWRIGLESLDAFALSMAAEWTIASAQRAKGVSRQTLIAAIEDGRLEATNGRQRHDQPGRQGDRWRFTEAAWLRFLASCPPCAWPGCDKPGVTPAGRCSRSHSGPLDRTKSAETRAKMSAAKKGQTRGVPRPHTPEWDEHIGAGIRQFWADLERSAARRQAKSEELRGHWETGTGAAAGYIATKSGPTRSRMFGRWAGSKGGRPRGYSDEEAEAVLELKRQHSEFGRLSLARRTGLTPKQVRAILDDVETDTLGG